MYSSFINNFNFHKVTEVVMAPHNHHYNRQLNFITHFILSGATTLSSNLKQYIFPSTNQQHKTFTLNKINQQRAMNDPISDLIWITSVAIICARAT